MFLFVVTFVLVFLATLLIWKLFSPSMPNFSFCINPCWGTPDFTCTGSDILPSTTILSVFFYRGTVSSSNLKAYIPLTP